MEHEGVARRRALGLAAVVVFSTMGACASQAGARSGDSSPSTPLAASAVAAAATQSATSTPSASTSLRRIGACSSGVGTTAQPHDAREAQVIAGFEPANAVSTSATRPSSQDVRRSAESLTTAPSIDAAALEAASTITLVSYGNLIGKSGGILVADPFINPQRCVYLVTVHAPYTPDHPVGVAATTYSTYNVVVDEATGTEIALQAGQDLTAIADRS